ncbi:MAG: glycoside hydrolase family 1 protein [Spirochaetia bacterium]
MYVGSDLAPRPFSFPPAFQLGVATSATQIEGGNLNHSWSRHATLGHIKDNSTPARACDHWNRVKQDTSLLRELGVNSYRFGIEWARVQPERGRFDEQALAQYRDEIALIVDSGILPMVTLHHFTNPLWFEEAGGFAAKDAPDTFAAYVEAVVQAVGDLVPQWITVNEPNAYLVNGYLYGLWPPAKKSMRQLRTAARGLMVSSQLATEVIRSSRSADGFRNAEIGVAHHLRVFQPLPGKLSTMACRRVEREFQERFVDSMSEGMDFLGVNYYTRERIGFSSRPRSGFIRRAESENGARNDLGWEIYPSGLSTLLRRYAKRSGLPVIITENGTADAADHFRARFIYDHLRELHLLMEEGMQIGGYFHWTLMDNFEWLEGETARFGLYECDFETQERKIRASGEFYQDLCAAGGVTHEMISRYLS